MDTPRSPASAPFAGIGVVVLAYGTVGTHLPLVDGLLREGVPAAAITIVHNPSSPDEPEQPAPPGCSLVRPAVNGGYSGGMNLGIAASRARQPRYLLLLTHDARLRAGALAKLWEKAGEEPQFGVLGPALMHVGTDRPFSFGGTSSAAGTLRHIRAEASAAAAVTRCDWVDGGAMLVKAEALDRVGSFDERFFMYCEEAELCLRVRRAGFAVGVVVGAIADQDPGGAKRPGPWSYLLTRNGAEYAREAAGVRGVIAAALRGGRGISINALRIVSRILRRHPQGVSEPIALLVGTGWGLVDFARRSWGPPPRHLPGASDVANATPAREVPPPSRQARL